MTRQFGWQDEHGREGFLRGRVGNGNGRPERGEGVDVAVSAQNLTGEPIRDGTVCLRIVSGARRVRLNVPEAHRSVLNDNETWQPRVGFNVLPTAEPDQLTLELRVAAANGRVLYRTTIDTQVDP